MNKQIKNAKVKKAGGISKTEITIWIVIIMIEIMFSSIIENMIWAIISWM